MPRRRQDVECTTLSVSHNPKSRSEVGEIILGIGRALAQQAAREDDAAEQAQRQQGRQKTARGDAAPVVAPPAVRGRE